MHRCYQVDPRNRCSPFVAEEDLSLAWVRWRFPWLSPVPTPSHSASRHPTPRLGRDSLSFFSTHARKSWRQAQVCLRPLVCFGQTRASRPPPLQHRVPTRAAGKSISRNSQLRQPYPDCSGAFSVAGRPALGTGTGPGLTTGLFQPHGILDVRMSLSTLSFLCRRRATAILRYGRNPCVIQADTEPPGRLPPAPGSHFRRSTPSPGDLSLA